MSMICHLNLTHLHFHMVIDSFQVREVPKHQQKYQPHFLVGKVEKISLIRFYLMRFIISSWWGAIPKKRYYSEKKTNKRNRSSKIWHAHRGWHIGLRNYFDEVWYLGCNFPILYCYIFLMKNIRNTECKR